MVEVPFIRKVEREVIVTVPVEKVVMKIIEVPRYEKRVIQNQVVKFVEEVYAC